jgi:hypothetical protein
MMNKAQRRIKAGTDLLAILACAALFGLPAIVYFFNMKP